MLKKANSRKKAELDYSVIYFKNAVIYLTNILSILTWTECANKSLGTSTFVVAMAESITSSFILTGVW